MSDQLVFDDEWARRVEAMYEIEDAARRRRIVRETLAVAPGERIADVGCGPGFYCAELAEEVGPSGSGAGVDESAVQSWLDEQRGGDFYAVATQICFTARRPG